jgi:hypothetical protein
MGCTQSKPALPAATHSTRIESQRSQGVKNADSALDITIEAEIQTPEVLTTNAPTATPAATRFTVPELFDYLSYGRSDGALDWNSLSFELRVFVSSTFTDTELERNILLQKILPDLQMEAAQYGARCTCEYKPLARALCSVAEKRRSQ